MNLIRPHRPVPQPGEVWQHLNGERCSILLLAFLSVEKPLVVYAPLGELFHAGTQGFCAKNPDYGDVGSEFEEIQFFEIHPHLHFGWTAQPLRPDPQNKSARLAWMDQSAKVWVRSLNNFLGEKTVAGNSRNRFEKLEIGECCG